MFGLIAGFGLAAAGPAPALPPPGAADGAEKGPGAEPAPVKVLPEEVRRWLSKARETALRSTEVVRIITLENIAVAQAEAGFPDDAVETFKASGTAGRADDRLAEVAAAVAGYDAARAVKIADGVADTKVRAVALAKTATAVAGAGDYPRAKAILARAAEACSAVRYPEDRISALVEVADTQARLGDVAGALETAAVIQNRIPVRDKNLPRSAAGEAVCGVVIAQVEAGDLAGAVRTAEILRGGQLWTGSALYEIALAQAAAGDIAGARRTADQNPVPFLKARSLVRVAAAARRVGDADAGDALTAQTRELARALPEIGTGTVLADLAVAAAEIDGIKPALRAVDEMRGVRPRDLASALTGVGAAAARTGEPAQAATCFRNARAAAADIKSSSDRGWAYREIARAEAEALGPDAVLKWVDDLADPLDRASALLGRVEGALARSAPARSADTVARLVRQLADKNREVGGNAVRALVRAGGVAVKPLAAQLSEGKAGADRARAGHVLGLLGPKAKAAVPELTLAVEDKDPAVRASAATALGGVGPDAWSAVRALTKALRDPDPPVRWSAAHALSKVGAARAVPALLEAMKDEAPRVRSSAAAAVAILDRDGRRAVPALVAALADKDAGVREAAANALGGMGAKAAEAVPPLRELADRKTEPAAVRRAAGEAVAQIQNP